MKFVYSAYFHDAYNWRLQSKIQLQNHRPSYTDRWFCPTGLDSRQGFMFTIILNQEKPYIIDQTQITTFQHSWHFWQVIIVAFHSDLFQLWSIILLLEFHDLCDSKLEQETRLQPEASMTANKIFILVFTLTYNLLTLTWETWPNFHDFVEQESSVKYYAFCLAYALIVLVNNGVLIGSSFFQVEIVNFILATCRLQGPCRMHSWKN